MPGSARGPQRRSTRRAGFLGRTSGAPAARLKVESRFDPSLVAALREFGHDVEELGVPDRDALGPAGMLVKHRRNGRIEATYDSRANGGALGL